MRKLVPIKSTWFITFLLMFSFFTTATLAPPSTSAAESFGSQVILTGMQFLGRPYQFGASIEQTKTFDCSSFTKYVFSKNGKYLPRKSKLQAQVGRFIPRNQIQKGDLLFFSIPGKPGVINHVAIYAGDNKILHTYGPGGVRFNKLSDGTLPQRYMTARRLWSLTNENKDPWEILGSLL